MCPHNILVQPSSKRWFANIDTLRCISLSLQLEQSLRGDSVADSGDTASKSLLQQNIDLRRKLEDEHSSYKRKLQAYQDGQARQAQLVQKLQAKVGRVSSVLLSSNVHQASIWDITGWHI